MASTLPEPHADKLWTILLRQSIEFSEGDPSSHYAQLSTIRSLSNVHAPLRGRPSCRTIHVREIIDHTLSFVTDKRSEKYSDLTSENPYAEICWYFPKAGMQFRISGKVEFGSNQEEINTIWSKLLDNQKLWWIWPQPGIARNSDETFENIEQMPRPSVPPKTFCMGKLLPDFVDILCNRKTPFWREVHVCEEGKNVSEESSWKIIPVNP